jgi:trigger factor
MAVTVETLEKLERKITLTLARDRHPVEVDTRLKRLARTVKMDGFRPGKVPMNVVAQRYGYSVHYEVMNDKVGEAFAKPPTKPSCAWPASPASPKKKAPRRRDGFRRRVRGVPRSQDRRPESAEVERSPPK